MHLPEALQQGINSLANSYKKSDLAKGRVQFSDRYRDKSEEVDRFLKSNLERTSYLVSRLPATYGAIYHVLSKVFFKDLETALDLGSGFGSGLWALSEHIPSLKKITAVESDLGNIQIAKELCSKAKVAAIYQTEWIRASLPMDLGIKAHDLVLLSYLIGELSGAARQDTLQLAWDLAKQWIVLIEPGTPEGFERVRIAREYWVSKGGTVMAPCPHSALCPIQAGDWCHFSQRIERTALAREIKGAELSYEDEKFSYVVIGKEKRENKRLARIIRHPQKHKGHINLELCAEEGLKKVTVSKKHGQIYSEAKKLHWGDCFEEE